MRKLAIAAAILAVARVPQADVALAEEAFIPPIVEATITGVTSEALSDGRYRVTIDASVVNTSDAPLEGVELMLVDAGGLPAEPGYEALAIGPMAVLEPVAVALELETYSSHELAGALRPVIAGSAVDTFGEPIAVWVEINEETAQ